MTEQRLRKHVKARKGEKEEGKTSIKKHQMGEISCRRDIGTKMWFSL